MLQFPKGYFEREVQDGHVVGELIKRAWAAQLEILSKIDEVCKKYNLTYYAYWGTLLGAVRHEGFIPWDDDLDIAMKREDYTKFLEVAPNELPEDYWILNDYIEEGWTNSLTRITNGNRVDFNEDRMKKFFGCPFVVGIDLFPLDYIPRNDAEATKQKQILSFIGILVTVVKGRKKAEETGATIEELQEYNISIAESLVELEKLCGIRFDGERSLLSQLFVLYDQVAALYTSEESDALTNFVNYVRSGYKVEKELLEEVIWVPFENTRIPIPKGYDSILRKTYGDYMIPIKGTSTHGDICFLGQIEKLVNLMEVKVSKTIAEKEEMFSWEQINALMYISGRKKKVIFVCNNMLDTIAYDGYVVKKLRQILQTFAENPDILIWWRACRIDAEDMSILEKLMPQLIAEYRELVKEYQEKQMGILDPGIGIAKVVELCDAYYGDDNKIAKLFRLSGKPVMIMDYKM